MKAQGFYVEGTEIKIPSHVTIVEGIDTYVGASIAAYDNTVDSKINALANVYVGKTQKASAAAFADTSTYAAKAYADEYNRRISSTYYTTNTTVAKAAADENGLNINSNYAQKSGTYNNLNAGYATKAGSANIAASDTNNALLTSYIKDMTTIAGSNGGVKLVATRGNGSTLTAVSNKELALQTTATTNAPGLMSAADKLKLNALSTNTATIRAAYATEAGQATHLTNARNITITGGASGKATFDGSADCKITLGSINAASITTGVLTTARGGTGNSDGTVAKLTTPRKINDVEFDGSAGVSFLGICNTAYDDSIKAVSIESPNPTDKVPRVFVVYFKNGHDCYGLQLNVNDTGVKPVYRNGKAVEDEVINIPKGSGIWFSTSIVQNEIVGYRIIEAPPFTIKLSGAVRGIGGVTDRDTIIDILTTADPHAFDSDWIKTYDSSGDKVYYNDQFPSYYDSSTGKLDLNKITRSGDYVISFNHNTYNTFQNYPEGLFGDPGSNAYHYFLTLKANMALNSRVQILLPAVGSGNSSMYIRRVSLGSWKSWVKFDGTAVSTVT